ncbi:MAG: glycosyltransferase, partial [Alphaproteobacteria bacterium]|nr:glycosyltransferase [Alphaproteobacteria bacterium]
MKLAVVIPAYNEAATIAGVVRSVAAFGQPIVVDDCSLDDTAASAAA